VSEKRMESVKEKKRKKGGKQSEREIEGNRNM
jgi:hypothetical protein